MAGNRVAYLPGCLRKPSQTVQVRAYRQRIAKIIFAQPGCERELFLELLRLYLVDLTVVSPPGGSVPGGRFHRGADVGDVYAVCLGKLP